MGHGRKKGMSREKWVVTNSNLGLEDSLPEEMVSEQSLGRIRKWYKG